MNSAARNRIPAFTIFEVTVVMAIMSVIAAMVTFSVNRLMDQMHVAEQIHLELNNYYKVRSTLWYDCALSDSIHVTDQQLRTYKNGSETTYKIADDLLLRSKSGLEGSLDLKALEITETKQEYGDEITILFEWKGEPMPWTFFNRANNAERVNQYFEKRNGGV